MDPQVLLQNTGNNWQADAGIVWLVEILNKIMKEGKIPEQWADSELVTIFIEKGNLLQCDNYRGIKLLEHSLKILEKVLDKTLRNIIHINNMQFGFSPGKETTDAKFMIRQVKEKRLEKNKKVLMAFLDFEKAYDRVPREVV